MNINLSRRQMLVAIMLVVAALLFQNYVLVPKTETMREEIPAKYLSQQKYEAYLKGTGISEEDMKKAIEEMKSAEERLVNEKSEFLASARLQREVTELAQSSGIIVQTLKPMNAVKQKKYMTLPIYFEANGTIKQLSDFLKAVEAHSTMLKVDKLVVNVTNMQNPRDLRFKIQVSGMSRI